MLAAISGAIGIGGVGGDPADCLGRFLVAAGS
jgi:hypothetical protein